MVLPAAVTTCDLTIGTDLDFFGNEASLSVTVQPVLGGTATALVWEATGQTINDNPMTVQSGGEAGTEVTIAVPHVDQAGFVDANGDPVTMWAYTVTAVATINGEDRTRSKNVQPLTGTTQIDVDLLPDSTLTAPFAIPVAGKNLSGAGSPEGVVVAAVGALYVDTAKTRGAALWRKDTGTGNTGWAVVAGDTGTRTVAAWDAAGVFSTGSLPAGWKVRAGIAGAVRIRRINNMVTVTISHVAAAVASTFDAIYTVPAGFQGIFVNDALATPMYTSGTVGKTFFMVPNLVRSGSQALNVDDFIYGAQVSFPTVQAWPTSLPGI